MTTISLRKIADLVALALGTFGGLALLGALAVWITSPPLVFGVEDKPALLSTEHGLRPTTEVVVQPTLSSMLVSQERLHEALWIAGLGIALIVGAAASYGLLRAVARFRHEATGSASPLQPGEDHQ